MRAELCRKKFVVHQLGHFLLQKSRQDVDRASDE